jgi:hypothetical protein
MPNLVTFEPATKKQTFALYACYKKDFRRLKTQISKTEASMLIQNFNLGNPLPNKYKILFDELDTTSPAKNKYSEIVKTAEKIVNKANKAANKSVNSPLYQYLTSDEIAQELIGVLGAEFKIGGAITNDVDKTDKKAYLMLGGGCGFAHLKWDKRNKKVGEIIKESNMIRDKVEQYYMSLIDKNYLLKLEKSGNPIQAHFMQNLAYNTAWNYKIIRYLNNLGYKNITTTSNYD